MHPPFKTLKTKVLGATFFCSGSPERDPILSKMLLPYGHGRTVGADKSRNKS